MSPVELAPVPVTDPEGQFRGATPRTPLTVAGLGVSLPEQRVTNDDLAVRLDTTDEWISTRTGIRARRVAGAGESTTALATRAGAAALDAAGLEPHHIGLVVVATSTPDTPCPSTAARVAAELGITGGGFDVNGACTGFVHAFLTAAGLLEGLNAPAALVIGAERYLTLIDPEDRSTAVLFGDGAGALVLATADPAPGGPGILASDLGGDPTGLAVLEVPAGQRHLRMDGPELFRRATRGLVDSATRTLDRAGATGADVDLYVPHQANARIVTATAARLGIEADRVVLDMGERANTSAASIPLALAAAERSGRLLPGMGVLISAIGAGLSWGSIYLRWDR